jgi:anti-sigma-K factor RskA
MTEPAASEDFDTLAGELALGLLEGEDRARAMRLYLSDRKFAGLVETWRLRFEPLYDAFDERPSRDLWPAIERRLAVFDGPRLRRTLRHWRMGAITSGAVAASLAAFVALRPPAPPVLVVRAPERTAIAQLGAEGAPALLAANYDPASGLLRIRAVRLPQSELAPELWVIPADGVPRSLGMLAADDVSKVSIAPGTRSLLQDGATLAVTFEPRDGTPHQAPSSAPIATGKISTI